MQRPCIRTIMTLLLLIMLVGCRQSKPMDSDLMRVKSINNEEHKRIILLMVDSLMPQAIEEGLRQKVLPTFQYLIDHGQFYKDMVSSFPTMSVTIDSSFITGKYADGHHVPGLNWYSSADEEMISYGTGPKEALKLGIHPILTNALVNLNGKHLNRKATTIYEDLAQKGLRSGSINGLIYRGPKDHTLRIPEWMQKMASLEPEMKVKGPDFFTMGTFANPLEGVHDMPEGVLNLFGLNNDYALEAAKYLIQAKKLPDFLYVYLPELDQKLHRKGPSELKGVIELDQQLQSLLQAFGSSEEALKDTIFVVMGDSGMTSILPNEQNPVIDLPAMFRDVQLLKAGEPVTEQTEIAFAVNETMAYVYRLKAGRTLKDIAQYMVHDPRIDFIAWKEGEWVHVTQGATSKHMKYKASGKLRDRYDQSWDIEQDSGVLDIHVHTTDQTIDYGLYPDVLQRLSSALHSHPGDYLVVTAKPGYELADKSSPTHKGGGGHGSIRQTESLVPLIICGTDQKPEYLRIVDLKSYLLRLLSEK